MLKLKPSPRITETLGEEAATDLAQWVTAAFDAFHAQLVTRDEYREILSRMDILERDMSELKVEVHELRRETNARFDAVNARFDAMETRFDTRFDAVNARFDAMGTRFDTRFDAMEERFDTRFDAVNARIDTIHDVVRSQTRWLIATLIALGGLISALITILEFIK